MKERDEKFYELCRQRDRIARELKEYEPKKSLLLELEDELIKLDEEVEKEGWFEERAEKLCELAVTALNKIYETLHAEPPKANIEGAMIACEVGSITFDADTQEWYFAGGN